MLTTTFIENISSELYPDLEIHPTTVAYIQTLLDPIVQVLNPVTDVDSILAWIPQAFTGEFGDEQVLTLTNLKETGATVDEIKQSFFKGLVAALVQPSGAYVEGHEGDDVILPWDVQVNLGAGTDNGDDVAIIFGVQPEDRALPVTITIGTNSFTHMLTCEFTYGLLLFFAVAGQQFIVTMFGVPLTINNIVRFALEDPEYRSNYTVEIGNMNHTFSTPEFMQGFATGAQWVGVDHHLYWKNLVHHTITDGAYTPINITF